MPEKVAQMKELFAMEVPANASGVPYKLGGAGGGLTATSTRVR
jgi:hypothetical protein